MYLSPAVLQTIGLDVKSVASHRGADSPQHPLLPPPVIALTKHWLSLNETMPPAWADFEMMDVADIVPYLTIFECHADDTFTFTFMGSAISAVLGKDLTGCVVSRGHQVWNEVNWFCRCKPVSDVGDIQVVSGLARPPHTSPIEYVAADFPFMSNNGGTVTHIVGVTVPRLN